MSEEAHGLRRGCKELNPNVNNDTKLLKHLNINKKIMLQYIFKKLSLKKFILQKFTL